MDNKTATNYIASYYYASVNYYPTFTGINIITDLCHCSCSYLQKIYLKSECSFKLKLHWFPFVAHLLYNESTTDQARGIWASCVRKYLFIIISYPINQAWKP